MASPETLATLKKEHQYHAQQAAALAQAIAVLEGHALLVVDDDVDVKADFKGLGITEAAKRLLRELGEPVDTGTIAQTLLKRGLETASKRFVPTVYATLDNSEDFVRVGGAGRKGKWQLKEQTKG